jgi:hypothetical protein
MDDITTLAEVAVVSPNLRLRKADILADLVASNLGAPRKLSAASRGPFRLCDARVVQLLRDLVTPITPSPSPVASPVIPLPSPSPGTAVSPPPSECMQWFGGVLILKCFTAHQLCMTPRIAFTWSCSAITITATQ